MLNRDVGRIGAGTSAPGLVAIVLGLGMLLAACAPASPTVRQADGQAPSTSGPKTLRIGILNEEPVAGIALFNGDSAGAIEPTFVYHAGLTMYDTKGVPQPHIAQKVPNLTDGDWVVHPDGRMELTWKIRPDVRWHDGTPLTSEDFVLGNQILQEPEFPLARGRGARLVSDVTAVDTQTFVMHFRRLFNEASASGPTAFPAVPRHIMGDVYARGDNQAVINHSYWAREFVGLGPYRLGDWQLGSYMEALAYDQYFLGRPKIDRLLIRYYTDPNTLVANLLSREVDLIPGGSLKVEHALSIREQWAPVGGGTVEPMLNKFRQMDLQRRDTNAPWVRDLRVRQAMAHLTDRQTLVETLQAGLTRPADVPLLPEEPVYALADQRGFARYPYDRARGERLLADAGWTRGPDGILRTAAGERFTFELGATGAIAAGGEGQEALVVVDQWKQGGIDGNYLFMAEDDQDVRQIRALVKGGHIRSGALEPTTVYTNYITAEIASEANRWRGSNRGGYSNPALDRLYDDHLAALDLSQRQGLMADMAKVAADDVAFIPLYYGFDVLVYRKGIQGLITPAAILRANVWNIHTWQLD